MFLAKQKPSSARKKELEYFIHCNCILFVAQIYHLQVQYCTVNNMPRIQTSSEMINERHKAMVNKL